jgi:hypothetical protein
MLKRTAVARKALLFIKKEKIELQDTDTVDLSWNNLQQPTQRLKQSNRTDNKQSAMKRQH